MFTRKCSLSEHLEGVIIHRKRVHDIKFMTLKNDVLVAKQSGRALGYRTNDFQFIIKSFSLAIDTCFVPQAWNVLQSRLLIKLKHHFSSQIVGKSSCNSKFSLCTSFFIEKKMTEKGRKTFSGAPISRWEITKEGDFLVSTSGLLSKYPC